MIASVEVMYSRVQPNSVYIVEDTHICYWGEYEGGLRRKDSFMKIVKHKLDDINAVHTKEALPASEFTHSTDCAVRAMDTHSRFRASTTMFKAGLNHSTHVMSNK
jgi:hypothetical protein